MAAVELKHYDFSWHIMEKFKQTPALQESAEGRSFGLKHRP
jgi:hypothetical protein